MFYFGQEAAAKVQIWEFFYDHELAFCSNLFNSAGEYIDSPEYTDAKIKSAVIANKKAVVFQKALIAIDTSDDEDSDDNLFIEPFQDINISDPEIRKIGPFFQALPSCFSLMLRFSTVNHKFRELICPCLKDMIGYTNKYGFKSILRSKPQKYYPQGMLQHISSFGNYCVYHTTIKIYLDQLYFKYSEKVEKVCSSYYSFY